MFEHLVRNWWNCLGRIGVGGGLVGEDVALGGDFEVFKDLCPSQCVLHLLLVDQDVSSELCA